MKTSSAAMQLTESLLVTAEITDFTDFAAIFRFNLVLLFKTVSLLIYTYSFKEKNLIKSKNFRKIRKNP